MDRLDNRVQTYAWGSLTVIPELLGRAPSGEPQAELWMGAHPSAPSRLRRAGDTRPLPAWIEQDPAGELGPAAVAAFGPRFPFLLKVLAAAAPLSLQAHPTLAQARAGFDREEQRGVPLDAPDRSFRDRSHKPELLCALTPFEALCGFRPLEETLRLLRDLAVPELDEIATDLRDDPGPGGLRAVFGRLLTVADPQRTELVDAVVGGCARLLAAGSDFAPAAGWALRLAHAYPGDAGVVATLLLNHLLLAPGEAVYVPAGQLHSYLSGTGVEIMASSDNVLRGGLTAKHVDVEALMEILDFTPGRVPVLRPERLPSGEEVYPVPAREFRLSRLALDGLREVTLDDRGAQILLCVEGALTCRAGATALDLRRGESVYVPASDPPPTLGGVGVLYRACTGL